MRRRRVDICGLLLAALLGGGCGGSELNSVRGAVSFQGQPVALGTIHFIPQAPGALPRAAQIKNGRYRLQLPSGAMRVEITASRPLPSERQTAPEMGPLYEDYLPAEFNSASTLTAEIAPRDQELNFDLAPTKPHE